MGWLPQVGGHVQCFYLDASLSIVKVHPGIITAVINPTTQTIDVRVGRSGQTFAALVKRTSPASPPALPYYIPM
jgi:hypothetical protein